MDLRVYVSLGTLLALEGEDTPSWARQTAYLLLDSKCAGSCAYCWLARGNTGRRVRLARVTWHPVKLEALLGKIHIFKRVCIQSVLAPGAADKLLRLVEVLRKAGARSISVALGAASPRFLELLRERGADHIGLGLDVASERISKRVWRPYSVYMYLETLRHAVKVYGRGRVYAHLIVGLGEDAPTLANMIDKIYAMGGRVALFAYTPVYEGRPPSLCYYRGAQIYMQLLESGLDPREYLEPGPGECWRVVKQPELSIVRRAVATSGCPWCNRPFYNESPRGPLYNIPWSPGLNEARRALHELLMCREQCS